MYVGFLIPSLLFLLTFVCSLAGPSRNSVLLCHGRAHASLPRPAEYRRIRTRCHARNHPLVAEGHSLTHMDQFQYYLDCLCCLIHPSVRAHSRSDLYNTLDRAHRALAGQETKSTRPAFPLCLVQASLVYGAPVMWVSSHFILR